MIFVFWIISGLAVLFAIAALQFNSKSKAVFFLWLSGLAVSGVMFSIQAEFLAWAQAVVATVCCGILILHTGLSGTNQRNLIISLDRKRVALVFCAVALVSAVLSVIWFSVINEKKLPSFTSGLTELGTQLTEGPFFLSLIVIILGAFLMLIGASVISRAEDEVQK